MKSWIMYVLANLMEVLFLWTFLLLGDWIDRYCFNHLLFLKFAIVLILEVQILSLFF